MTAPLLDVQDLRTHFRTRAGVVKAVDGVSFDLAPGASLGIVGESGSGKSVTSLSIMRLIEPPGFVAGGRILFHGRDMVGLSENEIRTIRGHEICLVFQDPMTALNPVYTAGAQVAEALLAHQQLGRQAAMERVVALFRLVGIPAPERRVHEYPHQLSAACASA
jgi:peptide/nickel transport system ATP-binding protein/oligopeptide transport system ATP-binding protein